jgi:hypothetical protein
MSVSFNCHCQERKKPIEERNWEVWHRHCNYSYFQYPRGQKHYSDYNLVYCKTCRALGRTKAKYVHGLKDRVSGG